MNKIYIKDGKLTCHDPTPDMIPTFLMFDPDYCIMSINPGNDFIPKFQSLRKNFLLLEKSPLEYDASHLLDVFAGKVSHATGDKYSALDILYTADLAALSKCTFCGWGCMVNRFQEKGKCGLGSTVHSNDSFTHIAEETVFNPAFVTNLYGCALRCKYCIEPELWDTSKMPPLDPQRYWAQANESIRENKGNINSIEFTNPTESLHGILNLLLNAPTHFQLPVVMNCHLFGSDLFYRIADPITDIWLPDLRYGNDECAKELSGIDNYMKYAKQGLDAICAKGNKVIVRILVLPGHVSCCHEPAIELLSKYRDYLWVSVLDQYVPEHEAHLVLGLSRRPTKEEIKAVEGLVLKHGLNNISDTGREFWRN